MARRSESLLASFTAAWPELSVFSAWVRGLGTRMVRVLGSLPGAELVARASAWSARGVGVAIAVSFVVGAFALAYGPGVSSVLGGYPVFGAYVPPVGADWWWGVWLTAWGGAVSVAWVCTPFSFLLRGAAALWCGFVLTAIAFVALCVLGYFLHGVWWHHSSLAASLGRHWLAGETVSWSIAGLFAFGFVVYALALSAFVHRRVAAVALLTGAVARVLRLVWRLVPLALVAVAGAWVLDLGFDEALLRVESLALAILDAAAVRAQAHGLDISIAPRWVWFGAGAVSLWATVELCAMMGRAVGLRLDRLNQRLAVARAGGLAPSARGEGRVAVASVSDVYDARTAAVVRLYQETKQRLELQRAALKDDFERLEERERALEVALAAIDSEESQAPLNAAPESRASGGEDGAVVGDGDEAEPDEDLVTGDVGASAEGVEPRAPTLSRELVDSFAPDPGESAPAVPAAGVGAPPPDEATLASVAEGVADVQARMRDLADAAAPDERENRFGGSTDELGLSTSTYDYGDADHTALEAEEDADESFDPYGVSELFDDEGWAPEQQDVAPGALPGGLDVLSSIEALDRGDDGEALGDLEVGPGGELSGDVASAYGGAESLAATIAQSSARAALSAAAAPPTDRQVGEVPVPGSGDVGAVPAPDVGLAGAPPQPRGEGVGRVAGVPATPALQADARAPGVETPAPSPEPVRPAPAVVVPPVGAGDPAPSSGPKLLTGLPVPKWDSSTVLGDIGTLALVEYQASDLSFVQDGPAAPQVAGDPVRVLARAASRYDLRPIVALAPRDREFFPQLCALVASGLLDPAPEREVAKRLYDDLRDRRRRYFASMSAVSRGLCAMREPSTRRLGEYLGGLLRTTNDVREVLK